MSLSRRLTVLVLLGAAMFFGTRAATREDWSTASLALVTVAVVALMWISAEAGAVRVSRRSTLLAAAGLGVVVASVGLVVSGVSALRLLLLGVPAGALVIIWLAPRISGDRPRS